MKRVLICLVLLSSPYRSENYRILGIFPIPGKSHMIMLETVMKGLAAKGHEVDVVSHFPLDNHVPRYNDISMRGTVPIFVNNVSVPLIEAKMSGVYKALKFFLNEAGGNNCKALFTSNVGTALKNTNKKYDLVVTHLAGTDCMLCFAHHFKVPVAVMISSVSVPWSCDRVGNPDNPSYITNYFMSFVNPLSLLERLTNAAILLIMKLMYAIAMKFENPKTREFFGPDCPDIGVLTYSTSLVLVNSHLSINVVRPNVPNFVEVGGLHIKPPKPLPKHLKNSLEVTSQYKGVIYLSMGSMIKSETIAPKKLQALFEAFGELPYKILWKATRENIPKGMDIPNNIQFERWLPQVDVLCHPSVKLFETHGGLFGTLESAYCGVPCLGIPFYADQQLNLKTSEAKGLAILVEYDSISKENILNAAKRLLDDPQYKSNAETVSKLFKERPVSALDTAIYWIEYVIRHNGAQHLRSIGADLPWYQYFLIDVGITLLTFLFVIIAFIYCISKCICRLLFKSWLLF